MKTWKIFAVGAACMAAFMLATPDDADARRMGGGRSFGGSSIMSRPAPAPRAPAGAAMPGSTMNRQATSNATGAAAGAATASRFGGMGGLFGGLLAGSLLGSLFMGHGFGAGGGGLLDIIIIGLIVYFGYRFLRRRRDNAAQTERTMYSGQDSPYSNPTFGNTAGPASGTGSAWDNLRSGGTAAAAARNFDEPQSDLIPADFDQEEFLRGAKMAYVRMQESWDKRDLDDIAQFATPAVLDVLKQQMADEPLPTTTELLLVNASLMEVKNEDGKQRAAVFFDVLMREDPNAAQPEQVREVWHFVRPLNTDESWKLDGIQQVV